MLFLNFEYSAEVVVELQSSRTCIISTAISRNILVIGLYVYDSFVVEDMRVVDPERVDAV